MVFMKPFNTIHTYILSEDMFFEIICIYSALFLHQKF